MADQGELAAIGLGSNLGDRAGNIQRAAWLLDGLPDSAVVRVSGMVETAPVRVDAAAPADLGGAYLNAALLLRTLVPPAELLEAMQAIERQLGRDRASMPHGGPRTIDLDLLLYGERVINQAGLVVPHPGLAGRRFVLGPLAEIAGEMVVPGTGGPGGQGE
ncbi:MAG: 2-amino-4-hydroxy-6-hydroxymethyldihydropteridine diphosphokinase, partial [Phycisphaerales bacterium]|nr:2-amino-4-hydroxy-6-hydroxymethyldihydropteridine diphosphokinase [Phycisphaerales bacterium]